MVSPKSGWGLQILLFLAVSCCHDVLPLFMVHTGCPSAYKAPASSLQWINFRAQLFCHLLQEVLPAQVSPSAGSYGTSYLSLHVPFFVIL